MPRRSGDNFGAGIAPPRTPRASRGDSFSRGTPFNGSVHPRKGKGAGIQGEAVFLDLLAKWDKDGKWQAWRKGMSLAHSQLVGAAERFTAIEVFHRQAMASGPAMDTSTALLAGFSSPNSPEGRWTVCINPRGSMITPQPTGNVPQREVFLNLTDDPDAPPQRLLELSLRPASRALKAAPPLNFNASLIGEVIEDSAISATQLHPDPTVGIGLLCVAIHETDLKVYFDATQLWRRERTADGRIVLRHVEVAASDPCPMFDPARHLTNATVVSCNCPAHLGVAFERLQARRALQQLGAQDLFPQRAPSGLTAPRRADDPGNPEGVRRRFFVLPSSRIPGEECKHCHACRWALGAPLAEPTDMQSLLSDYWSDVRRQRQIEDMDAPMADPRFLADLRNNLLDEQAFSGLDVTLLAACVGDAFGIVPQRIELGLGQLADPSTAGAAAQAALRAQGAAAFRFNEQRYAARPEDDTAAKFADWWVGRGTANVVLPYTGPGVVMNTPAIRPLPPGTVNLPTVIP